MILTNNFLTKYFRKKNRTSLSFIPEFENKISFVSKQIQIADKGLIKIIQIFKYNIDNKGNWQNWQNIYRLISTIDPSTSQG